jgi:hypothetical protein
LVEPRALGEEPVDDDRSGHAGQPHEGHGEHRTDQDEDELSGGRVVGGEVAAVEQRQAGDEGAGGADE